MATLKNTTINDTAFIRLPAGTTAERPSPATAGMIRYNTSLSRTEIFNGTSWVEPINPDIGEDTTGYRVEVFQNTGPGTWTVPSDVYNIHLLVVAGGGSGGHQVGGGGGAGGMIEITRYPVRPGTTIPYNVGAGGPAPGFQPSNNVSNPGTPSTFGDIVATGGGSGGNHIGTRSGPADSGGSGGGGGGGPGGNAQGGVNNTQYVGYRAVQYGFPGGNGVSGGGWSGGGGGGAGQRGTNAGNNLGGMGGSGRVSWILGEARYFAGGGGGCTENSGGQFGRGGIGGGGRGSSGNDQGKNDVDVNGKRNTGGGGGGTRDNPAGAGNGGPGVIIVRY